MELRVEVEEIPGGRRVARRFEGDVLVSEFHSETLPSGKVVQRQFDGSGNLMSDMQYHGMLEIAINWTFLRGEKQTVEYFSKKRLVSRASYERARLRFPDMPPADAALADHGGELLKFARTERAAQAAERRRHVPDARQAEQVDTSCKDLISSGTCADARSWIESPGHTLGERDRRASVRLVKRLAGLGAVRIVACEIDSYHVGEENSGHLVLELPVEAVARARLLKEVVRLAEALGHSGPPDDGQAYAHVMLD